MAKPGAKPKYTIAQQDHLTRHTAQMNARIKREHMRRQALGRVDSREPFKRFQRFVRDVFLVRPVRHAARTQRRGTRAKQRTREMISLRRRGR